MILFFFLCVGPPAGSSMDGVPKETNAQHVWTTVQPSHVTDRNINPLDGNMYFCSFQINNGDQWQSRLVHLQICGVFNYMQDEVKVNEMKK